MQVEINCLAHFIAQVKARSAMPRLRETFFRVYLMAKSSSYSSAGRSCKQKLRECSSPAHDEALLLFRGGGSLFPISSLVIRLVSVGGSSDSGEFKPFSSLGVRISSVYTVINVTEAVTYILRLSNLSEGYARKDKTGSSNLACLCRSSAPGILTYMLSFWII